MESSADDITERLRVAAKSEGLAFERYIDQGENPRYFHADCIKPGGKRYRLKLVNPTAKDPSGLCALYENQTYAHIYRSCKLRKIVCLPEPIRPDDHCQWDKYFFEELIAGVHCTSGDFGLIVNTLIKIRRHAHKIQDEIYLAGKECPVRPYRYSGATYRQRTFCDSGKALLSKKLLTDAHYKSAMAAWRKWSSWDRTCHCFAHGDFSFGNVLKVVGRLALIDFEHSHIGDPLIDVAHLYVNLLCDDEPSAIELKEMYFSKLENTDEKEEEAMFRKLTLERLLGKLNATDKADKQRLILGHVVNLIGE